MAATTGTHAAAPTRPAGLTKGERRWGYAVWAFAGGVIAVPELWAGLFGNPWFLTISDTVGHLEQRWSLVKILVIALIVAGAVQALAYPQRRQILASRGRQARWRSSKGRLTRAAGGATEEYRRAWFYFPAAVLVVAAAGAAAAGLTGSRYDTGYVIYGLIAVGLLIIPNMAAYFGRKEVPFPTLFRTLDEVDHRWHPALLIVVAGLAVLAVHLVAYPWP